MYIVLEYLLLENFIINFLILYINKILVKIQPKTKRIILGALIASFYSLVILYPRLKILTHPISKVIFSMLIILISYKYKGLKLFFKELLGFYLVSFVFAGATLGIYYSTGNMFSILNAKVDILNGFPFKYLIIGVLLSVIIVKSIFEYYNMRVLRDNYIVDIEIEYKNNVIKLKALLDTGHSLRDPFSNKSILVVEYELLKEYLPSGVGDLILANSENNFAEIEYLLKDIQNDILLSIVPFKSVGRNGIIFTFKPDSVTINNMNKESKRFDILIGIYSGSFSQEMGYAGLLNYELLNGGVENEYNVV